jgi:dTDP-4-dehydrorhamnose reductase
MILFFGKQGQLAQSFQACEPAGLKGRAVYISSVEANFEKLQAISGVLDRYSPSIVVVCSAYTQVDKAEEERELAFMINSKAPGEIARWCAKNDALMIHFSTDYVFNGQGTAPWKESDQPAALNYYGESKLLGERAVQDSGCRHLIFRTSWVVSEYGKNFVRTMLRLGKEKEVLRIVNDQHGAPTYAPDLAAAVWALIARVLQGEQLSSGVFHLAGQGETTWAAFAEAIFEEARLLGLELRVKMVEGIPTSEYPTPAARPLNSRLDQSRASSLLGLRMPYWHESLRLCLKRMGAL